MPSLPTAWRIDDQIYNRPHCPDLQDPGSPHHAGDGTGQACTESSGISENNCQAFGINQSITPEPPSVRDVSHCHLIVAGPEHAFTLRVVIGVPLVIDQGVLRGARLIHCIQGRESVSLEVVTVSRCVISAVNPLRELDVLLGPRVQ